MDATPREKAFLLAGPEQRLLESIARRLSRRLLPDHLTALALLAATGFAVAGALDLLWVAAALPLLGQTLTLLDVAGLAVAGAMAVALGGRAVGNLRALRGASRSGATRRSAPRGGPRPRTRRACARTGS